MQPDTIALLPERDRLEHRVRQMEIVTSALRDRALYRREVIGSVPVPLGQAIEGFEVELAGMRRRLSELMAVDAATPSQAPEPVDARA